MPKQRRPPRRRPSRNTVRDAQCALRKQRQDAWCARAAGRDFVCR